MSSVEKISIALTHEMAANVKALVAGGEFASSSEVIRTALREFQDRRNTRAKAIEEIGRLWDEGLASGEPIDAEIVFAELHQLVNEIEAQGDAA